MRREIKRAAVIVAATILVGLVTAPAFAQQNQCPDGWGYVVFGEGDPRSRGAEVAGDVVTAWNFFDSESRGVLVATSGADVIELGPAPVANDAMVAYDPLPHAGPWLIEGARGQVSVCVQAVTQPPPTTTTTTEPPTTTTLPPETTTTTTTVPPTTTTEPPTETTTTTTEPPTVTTTTAPPVAECVDADGDGFDDVTGEQCELPRTGVSLGVLGLGGLVLLSAGVALEALSRRRLEG